MSLNVVLPREPALGAFLADLPPQPALAARTLAHAWVGGGGELAVGKVAIRLVAGGSDYTAGAIHATPTRLEFCRVIVEKHGLSHDAWMHWSDQCADLAAHGFDPAARFPSIAIADVEPAELARLASAVRDLARLAG